MWFSKNLSKAEYHNSRCSKSIRVSKLFFCQNGVLLGRSFWQKNSLVTFILFELWLLWHLALLRFLLNHTLQLSKKGDKFHFYFLSPQIVRPSYGPEFAQIVLTVVQFFLEQSRKFEESGICHSSHRNVRYYQCSCCTSVALALTNCSHTPLPPDIRAAITFIY